MLMIAGSEVDEKRLADICDRYGIAKLEVFGSQARGAARPDSDIDVLYTLPPRSQTGLGDRAARRRAHRTAWPQG